MKAKADGFFVLQYDEEAITITPMSEYQFECNYCGVDLAQMNSLGQVMTTTGEHFAGFREWQIACAEWAESRKAQVKPSMLSTRALSPPF